MQRQSETFPDERVERQLSRTENQDDQRSHQECEGSRGVKLVRVREERQESVMIADVVRDSHIGGQQERDDARTKSDGEQDAANEFEPRNEVCVQCRRGNAEGSEVICHFAEVAQLAPPGLHELPAPIETNDQEEWRFQAGGGAHVPRSPR